MSGYTIDSRLGNQFIVYKIGRLVFTVGQLFSKTSEEVVFSNNQSIITGLPSAQKTVICYLVSFHANGDFSHHRLYIDSTGSIKSYWDNVRIAASGGSSMIQLIYVSSS